MKKTGRILLLVIWTLGLFGCGKTSEMDRTRTVDVYYLNKEETGIDSEPYKMQKQETDDQIRELLEILAMAPDDADYKATISSSFTIVSVERDEEQVILTVDEGYRNLNPTAEVLTRAALVRTITQLNGIEYVSMKVRNDPLTDRSGNPIGIMEASMFIDNAGDEINTYEKARLTLYFTDKSGTKLVEASRSVVYNTNISMEWTAAMPTPETQWWRS